MSYLVGYSLLALWVSLTNADDITRRLCMWTQPRVGVVRDVVYLDGGWQQYCMWDGSAWVRDTQINGPDHIQGLLYTMDFNRTFKADANFTDLFEDLHATGGVNDNPPFMSGYLFADDYEFYTYGGLSLLGTDADLLNGQLFEPERDSPKYNPGINFAVSYDSHYEPSLPEPITTNVTHGAGVSVPDLHMGFYFSGLQTPQGDGLVAFGTNRAEVTYNHLLKVEMTPMHLAKWHELPLPDTVAGRGGAGLAWIPVSDQGLLVVIGGVEYPMDAYGPGYFNTTMILQNNATGPGFMETVSVYDVNNNSWFSQPTTGNIPPQLTGFCTVVTHEAEPTSYQIYVYGGYNGVDLYGDINPDLYILSVPSFHWTKTMPPRPDPLGGRWGHVCVTPYPDQMFVIGGQGSFNTPKLSEGKIVEFLNMSSLTWQDEYNPRTWSNYTIPQAVRDVSDPARTADDMDAALAELFTARYTFDSSPWYPYPPASSDGKKIPLAAILGGTFGGVTLVSALCALWLCQRRSQRRRNRESEISNMTSTTMVDSNHLVNEWVHGQHKQSVSTIAMKADGSDTQGSVVVEIGGRAVRLVGSHTNSPSLLLPWRVPWATAEVSGESRQVEELPDTSTGPHRKFDGVVDDPDRRPGGSSLGHLVSSDGASTPNMTEDEGTLTTQGHLTQSNTIPSTLGGEIIANELAESGSTAMRSSDSTTSAMASPRHDSSVSSSLALSPLDTMASFYAQQVEGGGVARQYSDAADGTRSFATVNYSRPVHRRHASSMSSGVQIIEQHTATVASSDPSTPSSNPASPHTSIPRKPVRVALSPAILDQTQH
ncbi:hypothetical protein B0A52_01809 [Exophiala mesophila]|uniref:Uncharacterized protein n=1 Tax=Exophiala mesophila TaxID=212818 RepID=A0A438NG26_EXOME|nr:hypothetical protein B0A52_01809 [Exophiala mesophila]